MKKPRTVRTFLAGVLTALLVAGIVPHALAAAGMNIYIYPGINVYIDDQKLEPKDANGNPVMVFTYNGTTYLPVRAISEALGKPVQWEGSTNSVYVGSHNSGKPAVWLARYIKHIAAEAKLLVLVAELAFGFMAMESYCSNLPMPTTQPELNQPILM